MKWYRHGDVIINQITKEEYDSMDASPKSNLTIAYGEVTGHHHTLDAKAGTAQVLVNQTTQEAEAFKVDQKTELTHQEHKTISIPKGYYRVEFEKEYEPLEQAQRRVYD
ncbi:hypothetical protein CL622_07680 [archaeon]|nr:hypothetical protein [archaeon]|tara:strand:+ start:93 stop:419 length:327 start_codon:yes stop_codon:yes gene_type:complete